jgi:hypothetical protein
MWIFTVLPEFFIHLIFGIGLFGLVFTFFIGLIPLLRNYKLPIQILMTLVFVIGVYLEGSLASEKQWQQRVDQVKAELAIAQAKSSEKNVVIEEKVVTRTKIVKEKGDDIIKYIDRLVTEKIEVPGPEREKLIEITKYIENCPIPQEFIDLHNKAANLNK